MISRLLKTIPFLFLLVLFSFSVSAFAVSMTYLEDKTMILYPGAERDFEVTLQNMQGDQDEMAMVTIEEGHDVARVLDKKNIYKIKKGTKDTVSTIRISIPEGTPLGEEWIVKFKAVQVTEREGGTVGIAGGLASSFRVRVGPLPPPSSIILPKEKSAFDTQWVVAVLLMVMILSFLFFYKKKEKK